MPKTLSLYAPAKINLTLDVLKKKHNNYHKIKTVYHCIYSLKDTIKLFEVQKKDIVSISKADKNHLIKMEENLAYKAVKLLKKSLKIKKFIKIIIHKKIPISSGLGGASSDAAAVLKGLNKFWNLKLPLNTLTKLGARLGKDVPFFIFGGTALGENFGEKITPLKEIKNIEFKILPQKKWPKIKVNSNKKTQKMYGLLNLNECGKNKIKTKNLIKGIKNKDSKLILENLHNDFETIIPVQKGCHLSGSGPATFMAGEINK